MRIRATCDTIYKRVHQSIVPIELDRRTQYLLHNIFKIDQKRLSKLFMMSQQTFTCSMSPRETL